MLVNSRLLAMTGGHRGRLAAVTAVLCTITASYWLQAWFLAQALGGLVHSIRSAEPGLQPGVAPYLAGVLACGLGRLALQQLHSRLASSLGAAVRLDLRRSLARELLRPERLSDTSERGGARRLALSEGVDGVDSYITQYIPHAFQLQLLCPLLLAGLAWLNPLLAGALAMAVILAVGAPRLWGKLLANRGKQHWDSYEALSADFLEALQGMRTLKILDAVPRVRKKLKGRSDQLHRATVATMRTSLADTALADFGIQAGLLAAAALTALAAVGAGPLPAVPDPGLTYFALLLSSEVFRPVRDLARQWHSGYLGLSALGSIDAAGGPTTDDRDGADAIKREEAAAVAVPATHRPETLILDSLFFRFADDADWVLRDASARIRRGGITALAGVSGAGKSTLFDIILGFLEAEGNRMLDGRALQPDDVGVVSQRSYLFPGSIRANLLAVAPHATDSDLLQSLGQAGLGHELSTWPEGLDTVLGEAGGSVSGGQLQRLAIARALLADRPVLLLDEPTSALNAGLAAEVMDGLREQAREKIVLMIAHRPEVLAAADTVLRLEGGVLREAIPGDPASPGNLLEGAPQ
ncbi:ABC transporter ATP-binding protein/permease [Arthrobacter sp. CG_A4]|uniref:ABC transporter ATP-binding protein/permease n=1 Tax=Arthrobacter sp. CG_A4 TaxID=3071706 RepID=UPI002E09A710|nr:ATP-binding cassette subfamily C protein CydD [Arthrobacter sp. CG_A4]